MKSFQRKTARTVVLCLSVQPEHPATVIILLCLVRWVMESVNTIDKSMQLISKCHAPTCPQARATMHATLPTLTTWQMRNLLGFKSNNKSICERKYKHIKQQIKINTRYTWKTQTQEKPPMKIFIHLTKPGQARLREPNTAQPLTLYNGAITRLI